MTILHFQNISSLKAITSSIQSTYATFSNQLVALTGNLNAISLEISNLKTSLHRSQISTAERQSSSVLISLQLLQKKSTEAITSGLAVRAEAVTMLDTVQNFMSVAAQAQNAANRALAQVGIILIL